MKITKRIISALLAVVMLLGMVPVTTVRATESAVQFAGGDGTSENPYQVATAQQLDAVRYDLDASYTQTADIDLQGMEWEPIDLFDGTFYGNGYKISNMTITRAPYIDTGYAAGLFGDISGIVENVNLENINISINFERADNSDLTIGAIATMSQSPILTSKVSGNITVVSTHEIPDSNITVGGIVGYGDSLYCENRASIHVTSTNSGESLWCGGISGSGQAYGAVHGCANYGNIYVSGAGNVICGGIFSGGASVFHCVNYGEITVTSPYYCASGGIAGFSNFHTAWRSPDGCINFGNIKASGAGICFAGGIVGHNDYYYGNATTPNYNLAAYITADENYASQAGIAAGRICGGFPLGIEDNSCSLDSTTVNGSIPADVGPNTIHGISKTESEITAAVAPILAQIGQPAEGVISVNCDNVEVVNEYTGTYRIMAEVYNHSATEAKEAVFAILDIGNNAVFTNVYVTEYQLEYEPLAPLSSYTFEWTIQVDRSAYPDGGVHYFTVMAGAAGTATTLARGSIAIGAISSESNELDFTRDVWNFDNFTDNHCQITEEHKAALMQGLSPSDKAVMEFGLKYWGNGGHCYGMSASVILEKMNIFDFSSITGTEYIRDYSQDEAGNEQLHSILCYYQVTQGLKGPSQDKKRYRVLSPEQQLTELAQKADDVKYGGSPVLFSFGSDSGNHAVVAYAWEKRTLGEELFESSSTHKKYNNRILIYDCNVVDWNEANCLLFNDTDCQLFENNESAVPWAWEIPYYVNSYGFWSENPQAYLLQCTNDLNIIDAKNYETSIQNYEAELILRSSARITNPTTGQSWTVSENLGTVQGDTELIYYHSAAAPEFNGPADIHIILPDEAATYIVEPLSDSVDEMDFYVLYDDKFVGISGSDAAGVSFSENGEIALTGNSGDFNLTIADDNVPAGQFNTYTLTGSEAGDITVSVSNDGITVTGDNLNSVTIEASEGDTVDTVTITENAGVVTLERNGDDLVEDTPVSASLTGTYTTDLVMPAADLGVSAPDSVLRATLTFGEDGSASCTWEAVDLTAFRIFFHDMFVNAYYAMAYGAGITDLAEIEQFCMESTGLSVSDYMDTLVTDQAMIESFTPASTSGTYSYNADHSAILTDLAIMDVASDPTIENSFVLGGGTLYLTAASWDKPDYTFVCTAQ